MKLRLKREHEESHTLVMGDTGTGKTQLIYQYLDYIESIGDVAVVLDSQREFIQTHFSEARGDWVLNPKDERCPYWNISDEGTDEADFTAVVESLFPQAVGLSTEVSTIFHTWTTGIAAFLLAQYRPSTANFGDWMIDIREITERLKGSEHEHTLNQNAAPQFAGIIGTLNTAGKPLRMMPRRQEHRRCFSALHWASRPSGWIFITNTQKTRDALRPLQSMWLDLLLLNRLSLGKQPGPRIWFIFDELGSLNKLPQLHTAITESRKSANPIVFGIQNIAQLDMYGKQANTILSQAFTKFILATSEPHSSKMLSELIGEVEYRRIRETRSGSLLGRRDRNSYSGPEEQRKPLILASEVQGKDNLEGYMLQRGLVVPIKLPYIERPKIAAGLIERTIPPIPKRPATMPPKPVPPQPAAITGVL